MKNAENHLLPAGDAALLRVFLGSRDKGDGQGARPLYEVIVEAARDAGLAGATVFEGFMGFGANSVVHQTNLWHLSQDLPIVVEIVEAEETLRAFLPQLEALLTGGGLITLERVRVLRVAP